MSKRTKEQIASVAALVAKMAEPEVNLRVIAARNDPGIIAVAGIVNGMSQSEIDQRIAAVIGVA